MADERKKIFIETVEKLFYNAEDPTDIPSDAVLFFEDYKKGASAAKPFTEKGIAIIKEMREIDDWITAKSLGERLDVSGRSVSGTMRKLVTDGYIEKKTGNPISYKITDAGKTCNFEEI